MGENYLFGTNVNCKDVFLCNDQKLNILNMRIIWRLKIPGITIGILQNIK